jgi:catechol 2,3-dioxygenase-like lactoylglutathione lyase family enzyme
MHNRSSRKDRSMLTDLDHVVILVRDLARATEDYAALGFTVTPGGTHADGLTHNALIVFTDGSYLELIAFVDPGAAQDNIWGWRRFLDAGGGLIDYCVASDDLPADVARFQAQGLTLNGPTPGGRKRPDGAELRWLSASFWQAGRELPFLIQDLTARELRVPSGAAAQHPNGTTGIRELTIVTADLDRSSAGFGKLTGSAEPSCAPIAAVMPRSPHSSLAGTRWFLPSLPIRSVRSSSTSSRSGWGRAS